ncbi:MAG: MBL fold metallo-hydrolase [Bowdeniella nasicola]|nr:MBL fold metallo-hydrolase [Bowdeniella nasicola]
MIIQRFVSPCLATNCYVLIDWPSARAVVVDPGGRTAAPVRQRLEAMGVTLVAVLFTHGHPDHVWDGARLADGVPCYLPAPDHYRLDEPNLALPAAFDFAAISGEEWARPTDVRPLPDALLCGGGAPIAEGFTVRAVPAPGHTEGSTVFLVSASLADDIHRELPDPPRTADVEGPVLLAGDVLFAGSMGRTDLPGGDDEEMRSSLRTLRQTIDPATVVLPGHGPATTMAHENATNPYLHFRS